MEELSAAFSGSFQMSLEPNSTASPHPRFSQYKVKSGCSNQEKRRYEILQMQKDKRFDALKHVRCLTENKWEEGEEIEIEEQKVEELMETEVCWRKPGRYYKNQLMLSEWMLEVPDDFVDNWLMVLCPVGKRNLVVASGGVTKAFGKNGHHICTFLSPFPGGSRQTLRQKSDTTILDCVYDEVSQTFYILDMMCWRTTPIYDCETEFRFYWLKTKLSEEIGMQAATSDRLSRYRFEWLHSFPCDSESIQNAINQPLDFKLDGILFYHKQTHYTFGSTPLVLWLKAYMLPEILGIHVPDCFFVQIPSTYGSFTQHIKTVKKKQLDEERRKAKNIKKQDLQENSSVDQIKSIDDVKTDDQLEAQHSTVVMECADSDVDPTA